MSDDQNTPTEPYKCFDCGHTETAPVGDLAGEIVEVTVGEGRREKTVEVGVCPECGSEDWHSKGVAEALLGRDVGGDEADVE